MRVWPFNKRAFNTNMPTSAAPFSSSKKIQDLPHSGLAFGFGKATTQQKAVFHFFSFLDDFWGIDLFILPRQIN